MTVIADIKTRIGWVAYIITAFGCSVGGYRLMPPTPDNAGIVINGKTGYVRQNASWVIGRLIRDFEAWKDPRVDDKIKEITNKKMQQNKLTERPCRAGLCVSFYTPSLIKEASIPEKDLVYWSGFVVAALQLVIAAIPFVTFGDWGTLAITTGGIILCLVTGSLPQWRTEKWACRRNTKKTFVLTHGNGAQHAIVILGNSHGLDLEDLAGYFEPTLPAPLSITITFGILAALWIVLLITAAGQKTNTWSLMAVGGIGMIQNVGVAGWKRHPSAFGVHLDFKEAIGDSKVMETLFMVEERYPHVGRSMLKTFFPSELKENEKNRWAELKKRANGPS
jgi:hypothetical protein